MWAWLGAAGLALYLVCRSLSDRRLQAAEERRRARLAVAEAERDRLARLPATFAHYRERLEFVRERLAATLAEPGAAPGADLDEWPRRAPDFADVLGPTSEGYHVLAAAYRGVAAVAVSNNPERTQSVLQTIDGALAAVGEAIDKVTVAHR